MSLEIKTLKRPKTKTEAIDFSKKECEQCPNPTHDDLVIVAKIDNITVFRVMIDNGSAVNIIYLDVF